MSSPLALPDSGSHPLVRAILPGLLLATLTLLLGFGLGVVFGLNEEAITSRLAASAAAAPAAVYHGDSAIVKSVLGKSWAYMQRSHLHAGALGTTAIALSLVTVLLGLQPIVARGISVALGAGGLGYSLFWVWAGARAPALGSTGLAKESLSWLAIPSSGLVVAATLTVAVRSAGVSCSARPRGDTEVAIPQRRSAAARRPPPCRTWRDPTGTIALVASIDIRGDACIDALTSTRALPESTRRARRQFPAYN